jgi:hypothetical protein
MIKIVQLKKKCLCQLLAMYLNDMAPDGTMVHICDAVSYADIYVT